MFVQFRRGTLAGLMFAGFVLGCAQPADDDGGGQDVICEIETDDSQCDICIKTGCCQQYTTCYNDPSCMCVLNCSITGEGPDVCSERCGLADPDFNAVIANLDGGEQLCQVECQDPCSVVDPTDDDDDLTAVE